MKTKMFKRVVIASALALILAACGDEKKDATAPANSPSSEQSQQQAAESVKTVKIQHQSGETVVPLSPEKIISFDMSAIDTLEALGVDIIGLPKANIPTYLKEYDVDKYQNFGGLKEPDFEAVHGANPDLIIISLRQASLYDQFEEIAPTVNLSLDETNYIDSTINNIRTIGKIVDKEAEAEAQVKKLQEKVASIHEQTSKMPDKALILLVNDGKISSYGSGSRFGLIHDELGFKQADENIKISRHGQSASFEYVMDLNPDYLFIVDRTAILGNNDTSAKQIIENDLVKNTNAYKNNKIIYLDPNTWYLSGGGIESTNMMVDDIQKAIDQQLETIFYF